MGEGPFLISLWFFLESLVFTFRLKRTVPTLPHDCCDESFSVFEIWAEAFRLFLKYNGTRVPLVSWCSRHQQKAFFRDSKASSPSRNHEPVAQDNSQALLEAVSCWNKFFSFGKLQKEMHIKRLMPFGVYELWLASLWSVSTLLSAHWYEKENSFYIKLLTVRSVV